MSGWRARRGGQPRRLVTRLIGGVPAAAAVSLGGNPGQAGSYTRRDVEPTKPWVVGGGHGDIATSA